MAAIQANAMAPNMALAYGLGVSGQVGCDTCGGDNDGDPNAGICMPICIAASPMVLPYGLVETPTDLGAPFVMIIRLVAGRTSSPDPYPPK